MKEKTTGEPLIGCNIQIEGTTQGGTGDIKGEYFIINVRPGTYTIRATMIGYKTYKVTNVQVTADLTTQLNFLMESTTVEMGEMVVSAERPLIEKDITSKLSIVSSTSLLTVSL